MKTEPLPTRFGVEAALCSTGAASSRLRVLSVLSVLPSAAFAYGKEPEAARQVGFRVALDEMASLLCARMKAHVIVMPKQSVLDPQGVAVCQAIQHHGVAGVTNARVGKFIELDLDGTESEEALHALCRDLLSNPVIEDYRLELKS